MNDNINKEVISLPPFKRLCMTIGELPSSYVESMTYYEMLLWFTKYLQDTVIPALNNNAEAVNELQALFTELQTYVNNYFENLDVQEEINNKLDEMVESGEFEDLLSEYLDYIKQTYIIQDIEYYEGTFNNTKYYVAKVPHLDSNEDPIVLKSGFAKNNDTASAIANETAVDFAKRNYASFCVNASIFGVDSTEENYNRAMGCIIKNGNLISNYDNAGYTPQTQARMRMLGVKEDGSLKTYDFNTSYDTLISDGVVNSFCGYGTVFENGVYSFSAGDSENIWNFICQNTTTKDLYFICCQGRNIDGNLGIKPSDLANIMINTYGCDYGFALDGGGSTTFCKDGVMMNIPYDDVGTTIRLTPNYIYFSKQPETNFDYNMHEAFDFISENKSKIDYIYNKLKYLESIDSNTLSFNFPNIYTSTNDGMRLRYAENGNVHSAITFDSSTHPMRLGLYDVINDKSTAYIDGLSEEIMINDKIIGKFFNTAYNVDNLNNIYDGGVYRVTGTSSNSPLPNGVGGILICLKTQRGDARQIVIPQSTNYTISWYTRHCDEGHTVWYDWKVLFTYSE